MEYNDQETTANKTFHFQTAHGLQKIKSLIHP